MAAVSGAAEVADTTSSSLRKRQAAFQIIIKNRVNHLLLAARQGYRSFCALDEVIFFKVRVRLHGVEVVIVGVVVAGGGQ